MEGEVVAMTTRHMTRSQIVRTGGGLLAASVLAACGQTAEKPGAAPAAPVSTQAPATPAPRNVTIAIDNDWTQGDRLTVVNAWVARANKVYPNIKTELRANADTQEKTIAAFAADQQGDLVQLDQHMIPVFGPKGALADIGSTLATLKFDTTRLYDVDNITHFGGKLHGLLIQFNVNAWTYNVNAFKEAGLKEPTADWTWDDYLDTAKKLTRPNDERWGTTLVPGYPYAWYWSADVPYMDEKGTKTLWDTPASKEIMQWLVDLAQRHRVAPTVADAAEKKLNFNNGQFVFNVQTVPSPAVTKAIDGKFEWGVMATPRHPKTKKTANIVTGHNYLVTRKGANRGVTLEALQVLTELFHDDIQNMYVSGLNVSSLPITKHIAAKASTMAGMPASFKIALDVIPTGRNFDKVPGFLDFHNAFGPEFSKAANGQITVEQAAVNMVRLSDAALTQAAR